MNKLNSSLQSDHLDWRSEFRRLEGAYAPATLRSYATDIQIFADWCEEHRVSPLPATIETICAFLEAQAPSRTAATVKRRIYAISKIHRSLGLSDQTGHEQVNLALRRVSRAKLNRPKQAKGMNKELLMRCIAAQPDTPWGLRNKAMLSLGYDLLTRRSELVALRTEDIEMREDGTLRAIIRRSKSDPLGMGRIAFSSRHSAELVRQWLYWRGNEIEPLFCPIYKGKPINRALDPSKVRGIIKMAVSTVGIPLEEAKRFSGHSLRVGAAQDLLCAGYGSAAIMRAGGWKSSNVLARYLELTEENVWE